jgi:hypothetical protein
VSDDENDLTDSFAIQAVLYAVLVFGLLCYVLAVGHIVRMTIDVWSSIIGGAS